MCLELGAGMQDAYTF